MLPSLLLSALALLVAPMARTKEPQVFRTFMPEAGPSAFGVVLNPETTLCYDPLRGGVNQAWHGTLDLAPTLRAKINQPAQINGSVFYAETTVQPLRIQDADKIPDRRFKGYHYDSKGVTFTYTLDGVAVSETLRAAEDGRGLVRIWSIPPNVTLYLLTEQQTDSRVTFQGGTEVRTGIWKFVGAPDATFTMTIEPLKPAR